MHQCELRQTGAEPSLQERNLRHGVQVYDMPAHAQGGLRVVLGKR